MNILVVSAHPDDEVLGLGGTLARHAAEGAAVYPAIFANAAQVREGRDELRQACERSCAELGVKAPVFLGFPDQRLDTLPQIEVTQAIEALVKKHEPEIVYTHHFGDMNRDHQVLHDATLIACRAKPGAVVKRVLSYYVPSSTDWAPAEPHRAFLPNWFVDISGTIQTKLRALGHYALETPAFPHPRSLESIENQAKFWGSSVGFTHAEPFMLVRNLTAK